MKHTGFTLAELLIALAIMGVIATFTIPKILVSQQNAKFNAIGKEGAAAFTEALLNLKYETGITSATKATDLTPFLNYVKIDTSSAVDKDFDNAPGVFNCTSSDPCLRMHNGSVFWLYDNSFDGTSDLNAIIVLMDPDGEVTNQGDSIMFFLYYNGRMTSKGNRYPGSVNSEATFGACSGCDPAWFSWD